jgi:hypothetical protein
MNVVQEIKEAIADHKIELVNPSRDYSQGEIVYMRGYIEGLEAFLESLEEERREFKFILN